MLTREVPVLRRGKLDVCVEPPTIWWDGRARRGFRPKVVELLAAIMSSPVADPDELIDAMGWETHNTLRTKIGDLRTTLACAELPVKIVSVLKPDGRGVDGYRLDVLE